MLHFSRHAIWFSFAATAGHNRKPPIPAADPLMSSDAELIGRLNSQAARAARVRRADAFAMSDSQAFRTHCSQLIPPQTELHAAAAAADAVRMSLSKQLGERSSQMEQDRQRRAFRLITAAVCAALWWRNLTSGACMATPRKTPYRVALWAAEHRAPQKDPDQRQQGPRESRRARRDAASARRRVRHLPCRSVAAEGLQQGESPPSPSSTRVFRRSDRTEQRDLARAAAGAGTAPAARRQTTHVRPAQQRGAEAKRACLDRVRTSPLPPTSLRSSVLSALKPRQSLRRLTPPGPTSIRPFTIHRASPRPLRLRLPRDLLPRPRARFRTRSRVALRCRPRDEPGTALPAAAAPVLGRSAGRQQGARAAVHGLLDERGTYGPPCAVRRRRRPDGWPHSWRRRRLGRSLKSFVIAFDAF